MAALKSLGAGGKGKVAAILPDTTSSTRYVEFDQPDLRKALEAAGVPSSDIIIQNAQKSDQTFLTDAQTDITNGATVILSDPEDSGTGTQVEKLAAAHGVKVIDYDRLTLGGSRPYYVSFNNVTVGKVMGQGLVSCLSAQHVSKPQLIVMRGDPTDNNATLFYQGYYNGVIAPLVKSGKATVVAQPAGTWDPPTAATEFEQAYTAHKNANAALIPNDENGAPIITYLKSHGIKPNTFPTTGQDATLTGLQNVLNGYQCGTVYKAHLQGGPGSCRTGRLPAGGQDAAILAVERYHDDINEKKAGPVGAAHPGMGDHQEHEVDRCQGQVRAHQPALHRPIRRRVQEGGDQLVKPRDRCCVPARFGGRARRPGRPHHEHFQLPRPLLPSSPPDAGDSLLELRGVSKRFGPVQALNSVKLKLPPGKVTALIGDNGAGKSIADQDGVRAVGARRTARSCWEGTPVPSTDPRTPKRSASPRSTRTSRCATTWTSFRTCSSAMRRCSAGCSTSPRWSRPPVRRCTDLSVTTVRSIRQPVASLSGGQRQSVAVAKAVMSNAKLVIMDEPTAALGVAQTSMVLNLIKTLSSRGVAVLVVSHNLVDVFEVADRIAVLYLGQMAVSGPASDFDRQSAVEYMTDRRRRRHRGLIARRLEENRLGRLTPTPEPGTPAPSGSAAPGDIALSDAELTTVAPELLAESLPDYFRAWGRRIRNGESGALPIIVGLIIIVIFFQIEQSTFLTAGNLVNLFTQAGTYILFGAAEIACCCCPRSTSPLGTTPRSARS